MPNLMRRLRRRLRALLNPGAIDRDLADEVQSHIAFETDDIAHSESLAPHEAKRRAVVAFGGVDRFTEDHRDARGVRWLAELWEDTRYSVRALAHAPAFTVSAILVLALGIGASTAVFSAVNAVLLARLPYPNDDQLVRVFDQNSPTNRWTLSVVDVEAIERFNHSFTAVGAMRGRTVGVSAGHDTERLSAGYIMAGFVDALDVPLAAGRNFARTDEDLSSPPVTMLGHAYALRMFGSASAALDKTVTIDGVAHRVVGVFRAEDRRLANALNDVWPVFRRVAPTRRGPNGLVVIARRRADVSLEAAKRDLAEISVRIYSDWQTSFQDKTARLTPYSLRDVLVGNAAQPLALFSGAVLLVLLIAVANVASLAVVRCMRRWREIALRSVLGASRARLVRLIITESVVLAVAGGMLGVALGWAGLEALQRFASGIPRLDAAHLDARSLIVAAVVSLVAGLAIGIVPAMRLLAGKSDDAFRDGTRSIGDGKLTDRIRAAFVVAEFALALPVLAAGALLLVSVQKLERVDTGMDTHNVYAVSVALPSAASRDATSVAGFWTRIANELSQQPGIAAVSFGSALPPNDNGNSNNNFTLIDQPVAPGGAEPNVSWDFVSATFFSTFGVRLIEGRGFAPTDTGGNAPVILVTKAWANRYYAGRSAIGRELISGGCSTCPHTVVIGVVGDVTLDGLGTAREAVFTPLTEGWSSSLVLFVKSSAPAAVVTTQIREAVRAASPNASLGQMSAMDEQVYNSIAAPRHSATILVVFAAAALVMAAVGIFGLLSYAVALRRREIGVRMALGAPASSVVRSMIGGGMRYAIVGSIVGLALATLSARWLKRSLYETSAVDPKMLFAVTAGLLVVGLVASWLPARRAARIDPLEAMRPD